MKNTDLQTYVLMHRTLTVRESFLFSKTSIFIVELKRRFSISALWECAGNEIRFEL